MTLRTHIGEGILSRILAWAAGWLVTVVTDWLVMVVKAVRTDLLWKLSSDLYVYMLSLRVGEDKYIVMSSGQLPHTDLESGNKTW